MKGVQISNYHKGRNGKDVMSVMVKRSSSIITVLKKSALTKNPNILEKTDIPSKNTFEKKNKK